MHSLLFTIGPLSLYTYGLAMALGFLTAYALAHLQARRVGRSTDDLSNLLIWIMLAAVVGARLAYVIENWQVEFADNPLKIIRLDMGGLVFYGGFIGAVIATWLYCRFKKESPLAMGDFLFTLVPLGHAFGRFGCFMHGCCYGVRTESFIGVRFPQGSEPWIAQLNNGLIPDTASRSLPVVPTQLFETTGNLIIFCFLYTLYPRLRFRRGLTMGIYLVCYGVMRFCIEFFRDDQRARVWGGLSIGQFISCGVLATGLLLLAWAFSRKPVKTPEIV